MNIYYFDPVIQQSSVLVLIFVSLPAVFCFSFLTLAVCIIFISCVASGSGLANGLLDSILFLGIMVGGCV